MKTTKAQQNKETTSASPLGAKVHGKKRVIDGVVVSTKMKDTVVVLVKRYRKHPKYHKFQVITKRYMAHDAGNTRAEGDKVQIEETAPISKNKRFRVIGTVPASTAKAA